MGYCRTDAHRKRRRAMTGRWKPWEKSTGPKSLAGNAMSARNADKGATRAMLRELRRALRDRDVARQPLDE